MKDKLVLRLLIAGALGFILFLAMPTGVQASDWDWEYANQSVAAADHWAISHYMESGADFSGYLETASDSQLVDFFICDNYNYIEWTYGRSAVGYEECLDAHTYQFYLSIPSTNTWYVVVSNPSSSAVSFDIGVDDGGDSSPTYSTDIYSTTVYGEVLEPDWHYYVYDTYDAGTTLYGHVSTWISYDGVDIFYCDQSNYNLWYSGSSAVRYNLETDMHIATIDNFEVPYDGVWYLVISSGGEADTLTISFGFDYILPTASTTTSTTTSSTTTSDGGTVLSAQTMMIIGVVGIVGIVGLAAVMMVRSRKHGPAPHAETPSIPAGAKVLIVCPFCGGKNEQGILKCVHCGAEL